MKAPVPIEQIDPTQQSKKRKEKTTDDVEKLKRGCKKKVVEQSAQSKEPFEQNQSPTGTSNVFEYLEKDPVELNLRQVELDAMMNNKNFYINQIKNINLSLF